MRLLGELEGPELTQEAPGPGGLSGAAGTVCACRRLLTRPRDAPCGGTLASSSPLLGPSLVTHPLWLRGLSWQDTAPFALTAALWVCWCRRWLIFLQYLRQKQLFWHKTTEADEDSPLLYLVLSSQLHLQPPAARMRHGALR